MSAMITSIFSLLSRPPLVLAAIIIISLSALAAAFSSEAFLGLEPCIMCIYQRWPFVIAAVLGALGLAFKRFSRAFITLSGLTFLANSALALYHSGVERKWWASKVEGCEVPDFSAEPKSILENIMSAPTGNCTEIPWQDPLLGLSMANYNIALCLGLFALCMASTVLSKSRR